MKQYLQLEQLAQDYPKARERITNLQKNLKVSQFMHSPNESLVMNQKGEVASLEEVDANKSVVYSLDGSDLPFDIKNKTIKDLREMGFKDVVSFNVKHDPISGGARPYMPPEEKQRIMNLTKEMQADMNDPDFHFDTMGDDYDEDESLDHPKNERDRVTFAKIKKQKEIDDKRINLVYKALERGIPLPDDDLYVEMLQIYPYYQRVLAENQERINKIKRVREEGRKPGARYKFEERIKGRSNLNTIDVETVEVKPDADQEYYDKILRDYEAELKEIQTLSEAIEEDVIKEEDAVLAVKNQLAEEINTEKRLGSRYLTEILDSEAGSTLA